MATLVRISGPLPSSMVLGAELSDKPSVVSHQRWVLRFISWGTGYCRR